MNGINEDAPEASNSAPMFSVVIPTHNRPDRLGRALGSIVRQSIKDIEIVVVNDGSSVSYDDVLSEYKAHVTTYIENPQAGGASMARNKGILSAKGEWVAFLDDDDEFNAEYLTSVKAHIENGKLDNVFIWGIVQMNEYGEDGQLVKSYNNECLVRAHGSLSEASISIGASYGLCVKRQTLLDIGLFDTTYVVGEDTDLMIRMLNWGVSPSYISIIGVVKHEDMAPRLAMDYSRYSEYNIYERLYEKHSDFLDGFPDYVLGLYRWCAFVHYKRKNFKDGDAALRKMIAYKRINISTIEKYIEMKLVRLGVKFPFVNSIIQSFFGLYSKILSRG